MLVTRRPLLVIRAGGTESSSLTSLFATAMRTWGKHEVDYHCAPLRVRTKGPHILCTEMTV